MGSLVAASLSTVDNVEHLYLQGLTTGNYTIAVNSTSGASDYALAWQITAVPEPNSLAILALAASLVSLRRKRTY